MALLSFLGVAALLGVGLWLWNGPLRGAEDPIPQISSSEQLFRSAKDKADHALGTGTAGSQGTLTSDPAGSLRSLQDAWKDLDGAAAAGADATAVATLRTRISGGLDQLYNTPPSPPSLVTALSGGNQVIWLTQGPDGAAYYVSTDRSVRGSIQQPAARRSSLRPVRAAAWAWARPICWAWAVPTC